MEISINKYQVETIKWHRLEAGALFKDPNRVDSPLYMKTDELNNIELLTGRLSEDYIAGADVIDVTDKYVIVDK